MINFNNDTGSFDFLHQITKENTYSALFPESKVGLAIIILYSKKKAGHFTNGRFKESDIYSAFEEALKLSGNNTYERLPREHFNDLVIQLQSYFLRYDEDEQLYTFKDYAEVFCQQAEETLKANFDPTQIEIICNDLRQKLESCKSEKDIKNWIELHFETFKPKMNNQVDFLDRQIDTSVSEIRRTTQMQNESILFVLKQIDGKLDHLRKQNSELRAAFRELNTINRSLEKHSFSIDNEILSNQISDARQFIPGVKYSLNLIDKRLDRIQPKLRQFFGTLNKPLFNVKVEKFLRFLLEYSQIITENSKKVLQLPENVFTPAIYTKTPNFTIIERKSDLFPAISRKIINAPETSELRHKAYSFINNRIHQQDKVQEWIIDIQKKLTEKDKLSFSDFFFRIVEENQGDIEIASKVAKGLIRLSSYSNEFGIKTTDNLIFSSEINSLSIWEMIIYNKK
jgi:hypothetical protein